MRSPSAVCDQGTALAAPDATFIVDRPRLQRPHALRLGREEFQLVTCRIQNDEGGNPRPPTHAERETLRARPNFIPSLDLRRRLRGHADRVHGRRPSDPLLLVPIRPHVHQLHGLPRLRRGLAKPQQGRLERRAHGTPSGGEVQRHPASRQPRRRRLRRQRRSVRLDEGREGGGGGGRRRGARASTSERRRSGGGEKGGRTARRSREGGGERAPSAGESRDRERRRGEQEGGAEDEHGAEATGEHDL
mmetsp:Transcript_36795/g.85952  ORF Transcript_36795/g.85952 Transcript_36795/m.85952 type:complete len:247 (+) Transcript_36795:331-1071(+)